MKTMLKTALVATAMLTLPASAEPAVGKPIPKLSKLLSHTMLPATAGKVVLVDFWASWCVPCKASFPCMNRLNASYAKKGLVIIGISVDDKAEDFKGFVAKQKPAFVVAHDISHQAAEAFNPPGMPTSYLVDRKGNIRYIHKGFKGATTEREYTKEIEALLAEK